MDSLFRPHFLSTLLTLIICSALLHLGFWQLNRGALKTLAQTEYQSRHHQTISVDILEKAHYDLRFYKIYLEGKFDNGHPILIGNKLYTPFIIFGSDKMILVDRGFIPPGKEIEPIFGQQKIKGILNKMTGAGIDLKKLSKELQRPFYHYVLLQNRFDASSLSLSYEKHTLYAIAWFMVAGTLLFLFVFFSFWRNVEIR